MRKNFSILLIFRSVLIFTNLLLLSVCFGKMQWLFTFILLLIILLFQFYEFIRFVHTSHRNLLKFFTAIRNSDFSTSFPEGTPGGSFQALQDEFARLTELVKQANIEKVAQSEYLRQIVEHIGIGIVSYNQSGNIKLINSAARRLLEIPPLHKWQQIKSFHLQFFERVQAMQYGTNSLIEIATQTDTIQLSVQMAHIKLVEENLTILTFHNIRQEIEQKEIEAWQKLIRILAHEIMNSVTPIASLTETSMMLLEKPDGSQKKLPELNQRVITNVRLAFQTINKRSNSLLAFIKDYRKLAKVPKPEIETIECKAMIEQTVALLNAEAQKKGVKLLWQPAHEKLCIRADANQLEQVLINLIINAIDASTVNPAPCVEIRNFAQNDAVFIEIQDNGKGISPEKQEKVFIPFYTTKENGSGIGLSLSRQIVRQHNASLNLNSKPGKTIFSLKFDKTQARQLA